MANNSRKIFLLFFFGGEGGLLGVSLPRVFFFSCFCCQMALSSCPLLLQDTPCLFCYGLHTLCNLLKHVKSAHPLANPVPQTNQVVFSLQVSSLPVLLLGSIPLTSWGWLRAQSSSILGLFEFRFTCPHLFRKILQAI